MSSASSHVRDVLAGYLAGRVKAEQVVVAVAAAYYGERGAGSRERLKPLMGVIERAHPGMIELTSTTEKPGFTVRLAARPFPKEYEEALRGAVQAVLDEPEITAPHSPLPGPGLVSRLLGAIRRLFTASV